MIKNKEELFERLYSGEDIEKIIEDRLSYLNSEEYKSTLYPKIYGEDDENIILKNGFIPNDEIYGMVHNKREFKKAYGTMTSYVIDDNKIYYDILKELKELRPNIEVKIFAKIVLYCWHYFDDEKFATKYKDIYNYLVEFVKENLYGDNVREKVSMCINEYLYLKNYRKELSEIKYINLRKKCLRFLDKKEKNKSKEDFDAALFFYKSGILNEKIEERVFNSPINIKDIKGLKIGKCVEKSMVAQNILSFLGYNAYFVVGKVKNQGHAWNVVEQDGIYRTVDVGQFIDDDIFGKFDNPEQLLKFGEIFQKNFEGTIVGYHSLYERESDLKKIAEAGKMHRYDAQIFLERLSTYRKLHSINNEK